MIGDISDQDTVAQACEGIELVVHLAVLPLNLANADPAQAFETNVRGSFNVFDAAGKAGVSRVVYSSASSAYGPTDAYPIVEDQPLRPNAFYPASKAAAEMLLRGLAGHLRLQLHRAALHERLRPRPDRRAWFPRWRVRC